MEFALKAENVSIRYITGDFKDIGIKEYVTRKATNNYHVKEFMAVNGVSFTLEHGDMLGIVGTNGAGKSTLLKAVAGIMEPTKGKITANGEVAALLELGSGFDGDLTVKENAYLRGAMLGYTKEFMDQTYDHIIDFAELREFENRPFKQLSSGMKSRLAFSIASLVKPDILILDEVLSVGDGAFQEKSAKKMREIISQGATTILVSHSLEQIRQLCNKVLWLDHGRQVAFGDVTEVCDQYEKYLNGEINLQSVVEEKKECVKGNIDLQICGSEQNISQNIEIKKDLARTKSIDGIRGVASIIIALFHFGQVYPIGDFFSCGYLPVELFFILSGFFLLGSMEQKIHINPLKDAWKRVKRLYPVYFIGTMSLVLLYSFQWFGGDIASWLVSNPNYKVGLLAELTLLQATGISGFTYINYPAWYVSALILVTIVLIFAYRFCNKRLFKLLIWTSAIIAYPILIFTNSYSISGGYLSNSHVSVCILRSVAGLSLGAILYYIYNRYKMHSWNYNVLYAINIISFLAIIVTTVFAKTSKLDYIIIIPICVLLLTCLNLKGKKRIPYLENKFLQYMGMISYSFYIMQSFSQNIVQIYISELTSNNIILTACYLLINFVIGSVCYYLIELKLANYINSRNFTFQSTIKPIVAAAFAAFLVFLIGTNLYASSNQAQDTITIYSESAEKSVTYRGASVDGTWYSPWDNVSDYGNWVFDEEQATYIATDDSGLHVTLPQSGERTLTFTVGPNEGRVRVEIGEETQYFDLNQPETVALGLPFELSATSQATGNNHLVLTISLLLFVFFLILFCVMSENTSDGQAVQKGRELWGDILRIICCFIIILLHNTCNVFEVFTAGRVEILFVNALTAFAVPCFFMISGAYLLRKPISISDTLRKRIPKIVIPTLFWGTVYIAAFGDVQLLNFVKLIFQNQESHLWFMYSLFGIYMLLPFISKLYSSISLQAKLYLIILLLVIPTALYDSSKLLNVWIPNPAFAIFWPDLGLFMLGGLLWDLRDKIVNKPRYIFAITFLLGLFITIFGTIYISDFTGSANKGFISAIGSTGNVLMAGSLFVFILSLEGIFQKISNRTVRKIVYYMGSATMGVYLIHIIFLRTLNNTVNSMIPLFSNSGSLVQMILSALIYFTISMIVCICVSNIKIFKKLL